MRLLIFITTVFLLSCGQNASKKQETSSNDSVTTTKDTTVVTPAKPDTASTPEPTALSTSVNGFLNAKEGNKWHVLNDREAKWISGQFDYFIAPKRKENPDYPYIARGDFNGDGKTDLAAVVTNDTKTTFQLAIILDAGNDTRKIMYWDEDIMEDAAISTIPKSTIEGFEGERTKKVNMKAEGINVEYFEKASFVLYWNGAAFKRIQTGD
ncbi:MAG: hypothetical protein ABIR30_13215 [Chitinophagaceae bacterium]